MESSDAANATTSTNLLKLEKVRTKTRYTNLRRSLLAAIANDDVSKEDIKEQLRSIEKAMNDALAVINQLASAYAELKLHGLMDSVVEEAQDLETSYTMEVTQASETLYSMSGYNSSRSSCSLRYSRNQEKVRSYLKSLHAPVSHKEQNLDTEQGNAMSTEVSCTASGANDEHDHDGIGNTAFCTNVSVSIRDTST